MEKAKWLKGRKLITVNCDYCGNEFDKPETEHNRSEKLGRKKFCSRSCSGKVVAIANLKKYSGETNVSGLIAHNRRDEYSGFREFISKAKRRGKLGNLTVMDVKHQWDIQDGICPYTGIKLKLNSKDSRYKASLDRIDSNKLYEINNIQFVAQPINFMKNKLSSKETFEFCELIHKYYMNK